MADEVCHFVGDTDFAGHVNATAIVTPGNATTRIDVLARFDTTWLGFLHIRHLMEEISTWKGSELQTVAVNERYLVGDHPTRQQWDYFQRTPQGLQDHRIEGKGADEFRHKFPVFARHWDPAAFGRPWLADFQAASPERRADLDLKAPLPPGLRTPFALAFYWDRWLPAGGADFPVFLPGFKHDRLIQLPIAASGAKNGLQWQASVRMPALNSGRDSLVTVLLSPDRHLLQLGLDLHRSGQSAKGYIQQETCTGAPVPPAS